MPGLNSSRKPTDSIGESTLPPLFATEREAAPPKTQAQPDSAHLLASSARRPCTHCTRKHYIVLLDPTDQFIPHNAALVTANLLRRAGMNVEVQAMDWSTMLTRRAKKDPVDQGGWNLLHTWATGANLISPMTHFFVPANCDKAWFGWYCDPKVEELREQ